MTCKRVALKDDGTARAPSGIGRRARASRRLSRRVDNRMGNDGHPPRIPHTMHIVHAAHMALRGQRRRPQAQQAAGALLQ